MIFETLKRYVLALINIMARRIALAVGLMVTLGLTEGVSLLLLVPLLQLVGLDVQQGSIGQVAGFVSSFFSMIGVRPTLVTVLCVYILIVVVHSLLRRWETSVSLTLEHEFVVRLRQRLYEAIAHSSWLFFSRQRSSDFTHVLTLEMERVGAATYYVLTLLATAVISSVYILLALRLSVAMTGLVFLCGVGLSLALRGKTRVAQETGEGLSDAMNKLYNAVSEHLGGMKIAKSYGAEQRHVHAFAELAEQVRSMYTGAIQNQAEINYRFQIGSVLILGMILYVSVEIVSLPAAGVLLLLFLFARVMPKLSSIQQNFQSIVNLMPSFSRVMELTERCQEAAEPLSRESDRLELSREMSFEGVSFSYDGKTPVIRDLSLIIRAGETTAVVGPSGAGKSTLADLVMGLIRPTEGSILVDSQPLNAHRVSAWRKQIGYVPQETFLFHDTLEANLLWANPGAREEEMDIALKLSASKEFVAALPKGIHTVLGDRGILVSGGERQRLALARALIREPSLLVLDEATSSLDSENEIKIQRAIEDLHGRMTILIISHRLSTIRGADIIHLLEEGRVVESGTWDSLSRREGSRFQRLCEAQGIAPE